MRRGYVISRCPVELPNEQLADKISSAHYSDKDDGARCESLPSSHAFSLVTTDRYDKS